MGKIERDCGAGWHLAARYNEFEDLYYCVCGQPLENATEKYKKPKQESKPEALKYDDGKPPLSLLPAEALQEIAHVLAFGAKKYSPHNWRGGFNWSRLADACLRHLSSWCSGERLDPESGRSHLAHAGAMLLFLLTHEVNKMGTDDCYKKEVKSNG